MNERIIKLLQIWQEQKEKCIPESHYYYYCFGIEMGLKLALKELNK